ncbi:restriction endonuclease subunit M [Helicobacter pylori]|uniref:restriction endonuclease subunit M n=1 Tax=Helicobacter pylori TaxID=210 RepID=UPI000FDEF59F|nr:restriction endonuclease subunit M [Helicobacter pylori]RVY43779.1 restriction endonuclease subunit M [Helicobacter pylori]
MKNGIIAYLSHKRTENARNKKIIFFDIMKPLKGVRANAKQNRQSKQKRGLYHGKQPKQ